MSSFSVADKVRLLVCVWIKSDSNINVVRGVLKGWDPLVNLVLDDAVEEIRGKLKLFCVKAFWLSRLSESNQRIAFHRFSGPI